jgi:hypothetical protein
MTFQLKYDYIKGRLLSHLFALVMDDVKRDIQGGITWCMLFADDVVLVDESRTRLTRSWNCGDKL